MGLITKQPEQLSWEELKKRVVQGTLLAVEKVVRLQRLSDGYMVIWEDGKIVHKLAKDIPLPGEPGYVE